MNSELNESNYCRLARALLEKFGGTYEEALQRLGTFRLNLVCGDEIADSVALQAALLTAVNTGKRAFLGGVSVQMQPGVRCLLPWPGGETLDVTVQKLGAQLAEPSHSEHSHTLYFGSSMAPVADGLTVVCSGWRGGVAPADLPVLMDDKADFALGGVLGGALGVARGFLRVSGLSTRFVEKPTGISLWRPDLDWLEPTAAGPKLEFLPAKLWFLGLGHLGQAFLWNVALLPYVRPQDTHFLLQDFDRVVSGNWSAGLLCEEHAPGRYKTRVCAEWLEARGFRTRIVERAFDRTLRRNEEEPYVALCGFDSAAARRVLGGAGFSLVVECGVGGSADTFDQVFFHTFPDASSTPEEIWAEQNVNPIGVHSGLRDAFRTQDPCGILAETLSQKALSSSFVGAYAGALALGEVVRGLHGGIRCEAINSQLRSNSRPRVATIEENYQRRLALSGFLAANGMTSESGVSLP